MLKKLTIATFIAAAILIIVVLPAEYNIDPTGIGTALGLTELNQVHADKKSNAQRLVFVDTLSGNKDLSTLLPEDSEDPIPLPNPAVFQDQPQPPMERTFSLTLQPGEQTEIKMLMSAGKSADFSWSTEGGNLYVDFHGHIPDADAYWVRYKEEDEGNTGHGSLVAPFTGEHGWYFLNMIEQPITLKLQLHGFFNDIKNYGISSSEPF